MFIENNNTFELLGGIVFILVAIMTYVSNRENLNLGFLRVKGLEFLGDWGVTIFCLVFLLFGAFMIVKSFN